MDISSSDVSIIEPSYEAITILDSEDELMALASPQRDHQAGNIFNNKSHDQFSRLSHQRSVGAADVTWNVSDILGSDSEAVCSSVKRSLPGCGGLGDSVAPHDTVHQNDGDDSWKVWLRNSSTDNEDCDVSMREVDDVGGAAPNVIISSGSEQEGECEFPNSCEDVQDDSEGSETDDESQEHDDGQAEGGMLASLPPVEELFRCHTRYQVVQTGSLTSRRKLQLINESQRLSLLRDIMMNDYKRLMEVKYTTNIHILPDGGLSIMKKINKSKTTAMKLSERIAFINKKLKSIRIFKIQDEEDGEELNGESDGKPRWQQQGKSEENRGGINPPGAAPGIGTSTALPVGAPPAGIHAASETPFIDDKVLEELKGGLGDEVCEPRPEPLKVTGLNCELLAHQVTAVKWMLAREEKKFCPGGILADDMGLGKTLSSIALTLAAPDSHSSSSSSSSESEDELTIQTGKRVKGRSLVLCPSSVMGQWEEEVKTRTRRGAISTCLHHGHKREKRPSRLGMYDLVISSYTVAQKEHASSPVGPLMQVRWSRIILDEAHTIRNYKTKTAQAVHALKGHKKWCLTGTPIQNKELDLYSLLKFLGCHPFNDLTVWKRWIETKDAAAADRLNCILKSIMLRREKKDMQTLDLQPKNINVITFKLFEAEQKIYEQIILLSRALLDQFLTQRAEKENIDVGMFMEQRTASPYEKLFEHNPNLRDLYSKYSANMVKTHVILVLLLRLRQICCHPYLVSTMLEEGDVEGSNNEERVAVQQLSECDSLMRKSLGMTTGLTLSPLSKDTISSKLETMFTYLEDIFEKSEDDKVVIVSQFKKFLDMVQVFLEQRNISYCCLNGSVPVAERKDIILQFNKKPRKPRVMLLSLQAGGTGLNLTGANHLMILDLHWNPQQERQAFDRVHRVGQTKPVFIYKFVCEETIEERILRLQEQKLKLAEAVLEGRSSVSANTLTLQDLKMLFQVK